MPGKLLARQRALVTGASSGIGAAVAQAFAQAGAAVAVHYHSDSGSAQQLVDHITACGGQALALQADIAKPDACRRLVEAAAEQMQGLDILVANAGIQRDAPVAELSLQDWRDVLDVNLTGQFLCAQEAIRRFRRQGLDAQRSSALGKIIFVSSVHQRIPWAGHANYAAAKGGLKLLMESLAQEVAAEKIRVNALAPGAIRTPINKAAWETEQALGELLRLIPAGRIGEPDDVARAAVWLASDASDYVVGATLFVDGGMSLYPAFRHAG
jgi:glucose 1-dehydrogenase